MLSRLSEAPRVLLGIFSKVQSAKAINDGKIQADGIRLLNVERSHDAERNTPRASSSSLYTTPSLDATSSNQGKLRRLRRRITGWRAGTLNFAVCASTVFVINLVITIWSFSKATSNKNDEVFMEKDCNEIKIWNSALHAIINVFSTILLGGSNYCMQVLSAPTRKDIDQAHAKGISLDIANSSVRNIRHIGLRRAFIWLLLGASSLPLHLMYNSVVYATTMSNDYKAFVATEAFLNDTECRNCTWPELEKLWRGSKLPSGELNGLDRLETTQCLEEYSVYVQSRRRNLLLMTREDGFVGERNYSKPSDYIYYESDKRVENPNIYQTFRFNAEMATWPGFTWEQPYGWILSGDHSDQAPEKALQELERAPQNWKVGSYDYNTAEPVLLQWPVLYCLSERATPHCKLRFSRVIAVVVTCLNFVKAALMYYVVYSADEDPILNIGDAIASFLEFEDHTTDELSVLSLSSKRKGYKASTKAWSDERHRWKDATSRRRRTFTIAVFASAVITVIALLIYATKEMDRVSSISFANALRIGLGAVDTRTLIHTWTVSTDVAVLAIISNLPQVALSILYFLYNGLFTEMLTGQEWVSYAHERKGLRVTRKPRCEQRSTYFLQVPYKYGLPLAFLSGTLHWLVSQSIFFVAIDVYTSYGDEMRGYSTKTCGYSPIAMLIVVILGVILTVAIIAVGFLPYKPGMPLPGSSSMAISAACHRRGAVSFANRQMYAEKLKWGVVETDRDGIGYCAFSSQEITPLVRGRLYR